MTRRNTIFLLRGLVSALLIGWLLTRFDLTDLTAAFVSPRWLILIGALAIYVVSAFGGALQWSWILRASGLQIADWDVRRAYFVGLFFLYSLASPLIAGVGRDAQHIAEHIAARVDERTPQRRSLTAWAASSPSSR